MSVVGGALAGEGALARDALLADQLAHLPYGSRTFAPDDPPVRIGASGSGDDLLLLAWSATDLEHEIAAGTRLLGGLGIRPGMRVGNTLPGALWTPGALLLGDVHEAMGVLDVPLGAIESEAAARAAWELADRVACDVLVLDPASAARFFAAAPAQPRPWWSGIVWLHRGGVTAALPSPPAGFDGWQHGWLAVPEVACFVAGSCPTGRWHVDAGVGAEVADGALLLRRGGWPPRPYVTGLAARLDARCACEAPGPALVF